MYIFGLTTKELKSNFFLTENSESDDFRSPEKEALRRCWRRLVNGLDVEKLLEKLEERRIPAKSRVSLKQYVSAKTKWFN